MGFLALVLYGIGDMLGSGIYALMGSYAARMGNAVWVAFLVSMVAALCTGLSYACVGSRYPRAAGAAYVVQRAFGSSFLTYVLGLTVLASGLTSMGTATRAFSTQLSALVPLPVSVLMVAFLGALTAINLRGIRESVWANNLCTVVEVSGLLIVVAVGSRYWGGCDYLATPVDPATGQSVGLSLPLALAGGVLTFYSFVGFEDMLNVAEEVKDPRVTLPLALVVAVVVTAVLYMAVAITAVSVVPHAQLAASKRPLVDVVRMAAPWLDSRLFAVIRLFAIANTALLNYIMGSRLVYGMARQALLPRALGHIHPRRRTPHVAILTLAVIILGLTFTVGMADLATATGLLLLVVFAIVNAALIVLKQRPGEPRGRFEVPTVVPALGIVICLTLVAVRVREALHRPGGWVAPVTSLGLIAAIMVLYAIMRPRGVDDIGAMGPDDESADHRG
jgi:amino acid transporter